MCFRRLLFQEQYITLFWHNMNSFRYDLNFSFSIYSKYFYFTKKYQTHMTDVLATRKRPPEVVTIRGLSLCFGNLTCLHQN